MLASDQRKLYRAAHSVSSGNKPYTVADTYRFLVMSMSPAYNERVLALQELNNSFWEQEYLRENAID